MHYLYAQDQKESIDSSLSDPLGNQNIGFDAALFLWQNRLQLFGEGYFSTKDTIGFGSDNDYSYKTGADFRYNNFKLTGFYQRLGYNYYSAGYPFLLNDREGFRIQSAYSFPKLFIVNVDAEQYDNNLDDIEVTPTTTTRIAELSVTSALPKAPEITVLYGFRDDISDLLTIENFGNSKTDKISRKYELRISQSFNINRVSLTTIYLDLDDNSLIPGGAPLGTEQFVGSLNFYLRPRTNFFISGGAVYSRLILTDSKESRNYFLYQSSRWDILPQKLVFESNINFSLNDSKNGGNDDLLNKFWQGDGRISLEYFFNTNFSLKLIGGTNMRQMDYSSREALEVLISPDVEPTFFNGNESYNALIYGAEINWIF